MAFVVDDPTVIAIKSEVIAVICIPANEHKFEPALIVGDFGLEMVTRVGEQVNVVSRQVVDEMQIAETHLIRVEADGVGAVGLSHEIDGHGAHVFTANHCIVLAVLRDI